MVDYSRWKNIEVSDDEDETHPNIDTPSLFRWRHEARLQRMEEMKEEKEEIAKAKEELSIKKEDIDSKRKSGEDVSHLERTFNSAAANLAERENAFLKAEKSAPWNVDTIGQPGFSKTVINTNPKPSDDDVELSIEEKGKRLHAFTKENEPLLKQFGLLQKIQDSKRFLEEHPQLICEDTANYLVIWCVELAMEEKFELMNHVSHQCICMQFLLDLAKQLYRDPRTCVGSFFSKMNQKNKGQLDDYKQAFDAELELFRKRVRARAEEKIQEAMEEAEEEERQARLGPGGLDPVEVFKSLPQVLKTCFETKDVPLLQKTLLELPEEDARYHMKRCVDAGMWYPSKESEEEQGDGDKMKHEDKEDSDSGENSQQFQELKNSCQE
ncbi:unnamed protein product [Orchesella dallaii]|uniref:Hsp90 chaperone protein kinase-targeting subunit n=1 Tax=Orchesella dallaii TaxID=48710 RepID=A0ABP1Q1U0_9HEXA